MVSLSVEKSENNHTVVFDLEEEFIGKSLQQNPPISVVVVNETVAVVRQREDCPRASSKYL